MPIRVLAPDVAATIAAGEVVERPASVVKELVENALDAGASTISIDLAGGGTESIRVTDNGSGIPEAEVELAFARHATSKLQMTDDLDRITTLGFRGEALPSIAAAAHVTVVTRSSSAGSATRLELDGGRIVRQSVTSAAPGTSVTVERLFHSLPARRKYMRSVSAEGSRAQQTAGHLALAHPSVQFVLHADGRRGLHTSGNGSLRDVMAALHGAELAAALLDVEASGPAAYRVTGIIGPASVSRSNRNGISIFVNRRWIQSRALQVAVEEAYRGFLTVSRYPVAVLFLEVPAAEVDVNVHPIKREVRFVREGDAFSSVQRAVRERLLAASPITEALVPSAPPAPATDGVKALELPHFEESARAATLAPRPDAEAPPPRPDPGGPPIPTLAMPSLRVMGQMANLYVVTEGPEGMYLIDQHAAHEQVLFERLMRQWEEKQPEVQALLEPPPLELTPEQVEVMEQAAPLLQGYGFQVEPFGDGAWLVRTVPAMARRVSLTRLAAEMLDLLREGPGALGPPHRALAVSIACHSAVRAGMALEHQELVSLVEALATAENPRHCPHGRPTTVHLSRGALDREFRRT